MVPKKSAQKRETVVSKKAKKAAEYTYFKLTDTYKDGLRIKEDIVEDVAFEVLSDNDVVNNVHNRLLTSPAVCANDAEHNSVAAAQESTEEDEDEPNTIDVIDGEFIDENCCN